MKLHRDGKTHKAEEGRIYKPTDQPTRDELEYILWKFIDSHDILEGHDESCLARCLATTLYFTYVE